MPPAPPSHFFKDYKMFIVIMTSTFLLLNVLGFSKVEARENKFNWRDKATSGEIELSHMQWWLNQVNDWFAVSGDDIMREIVCRFDDGKSISIDELNESTGISKSNLIQAVRKLMRRGLLKVSEESKFEWLLNDQKWNDMVFLEPASRDAYKRIKSYQDWCFNSACGVEVK